MQTSDFDDVDTNADTNPRFDVGQRVAYGSRVCRVQRVDVPGRVVLTDAFGGHIVTDAKACEPLPTGRR